MLYRTVSAPEQSRYVTTTFMGMNQKSLIEDGEFQFMKNMTSDEFPLLASRRLRSYGDEIVNPGGMLAKVSLADVRDGTLYYSGLATPITDLDPVAVTRSTTEPENPSAGDYWFNTTTHVCKRYVGSEWLECEYPSKQLVSMGSYICIFPDGKYYNTMDSSDYGSMGATHQTSGDVTFQICLQNGQLYSQTPSTGDSAPSDPSNGDLWIDTSEATYSLHQWSDAQDQWVNIPTVYTKITFPTGVDLREKFSEGDGVTVSNITGGTEIEALNGSHILYGVEEDSIVIVGLISRDDYVSVYDAEHPVTITRSVPKMDYVCECNNRLWGCYYGTDGTQNLNELYCCALGDFKNWESYRGIATDSWRASVGTDGPWTGCINYLGYPTFFKEDRMHRISVSSSGAHQVSDIPCRGVKKGSWKTLAMVDEILYYVSRDCVCAYDGSLPVSVSENLKYNFRFGAAGSIGKKYYLSAYSDGWHMMVYDTSKGLWHREDNECAQCFARLGSDLCFVSAKDLRFWYVMGTEGTAEDVTGINDWWEVQTGLLGYSYTVKNRQTALPEQKYVSRYDFRVSMAAGSALSLSVEYDSNGTWLSQGTITVPATTTNSFVIPVRPRRCDHLRFKLTGKGAVKVYSIARVLEVGSDVV